MPPSRPAADLPAKCSRREQALEFLLGRINYERTPTLPYGQRQMKLDRMRQLLNRLGNPDAGLPIVHVAGTKGKGSTSALMASILQSAGYETGLFSSPHLERIEERFAVGGLPCTAEELVTLVERLRLAVQTMDEEAASSADTSLSPTYFELTTALALLHFVERQVDVAVLEVGLGGRLDSTNVCQPAVTVITSISLDHTKQLGTTLPQIAAEKGGILKPGVPVYCGPLHHSAREVIAEMAQRHGCRMVEAGRDFRYEYRPPLRLDLEEEFGQLDVVGDFAGEPIELSDLPLRLAGEHQAANAALAVAVCEELRRQGWSISGEAIQTGLAELTLPARIEVIRRQPTVVLDVAHNVASAQALVEVLLSSFTCEERILVLAVSRDKDVAGIVRVLLPHFQRVVLTAYQDNPRAVPVEQLRRIVGKQLQRAARQDAVEIFDAPLPQDAWLQAEALAGPDQLVCITGSFFIAAELRPLLRAES
ncbi:MAG: bifunctional folylpolyglutamate synthase/dihydrofolate synthase [Pirellulales bacterium]|nr:bifunctional folylpolyglutamate synthase/dihydrofolate synthase [Pirellulales bacterium]